MRWRWIWSVVPVLLAAGAAGPPLRLGAPAPDWAVETPAGKGASLMDCVRRQKRETVLLAPGAGEAIPKADLEKAAARLAESGADLLAVPPQPEPGRPGLDSIAPATLLVDASGVIRRLEPGRLLA